MKSTVPTVKGQLVTLLEQQGELSAVQVAWGEPGTDSIQQECVFVGRAVKNEAQATNVKREENYTVEVWASVLYPADDSQTAETRAWTLAGAVEDAIAANRRLGLPGTVLDCEVRGQEDANFRTDQGRVVNVVTRVGVRARI